MQSFVSVLKSCNRALPTNVMFYKHSMLLHKLLNNQNPTTGWLDLKFFQTFSQRGTRFKAFKENRVKIVNKILINKFTILNKRLTKSN